MPGIANRTVPRLRAQPGSLLSLLPVRNVKDQPVGGSRREHNTHAEKYTRTDTELHRQKSRAHAGTQTRAPTLRHKHTSGLAHYGITSRGLQPGQAMRPQLR